jgi:hypothetical protein
MPGYGWCLTVALLATSPAPLPNVETQEGCREVKAMAAMTMARSRGALETLRLEGGTGYRARLVYAIRRFELNKKDRDAAASVLALIPRDANEDSVLHDFEYTLCQEETDRELTALAKFGGRLPAILAEAVLLAPARMTEYVAYSIPSVRDPHSDYATQMESVCRANHRDFVSAVDALAPREKRWFVTRVLNPNGCKALALPER